jgi:hypothetical protein
MADPRYTAIDVTLVESSGPIFSVGEPTMLCRFKAVHLPGTQLDEGKISVVVRDSVTKQWREYARQTTVDQAREVAARLETLGMPGRTPQVKGVVDTSDGWTHLLLRIRAEGKVVSLDIDMQLSGFDGADAEQLRELFRYLFALAGFKTYCPAVYGPRRTGR